MQDARGQIRALRAIDRCYIRSQCCAIVCDSSEVGVSGRSLDMNQLEGHACRQLRLDTRFKTHNCRVRHTMGNDCDVTGSSCRVEDPYDVQ